MQVFALSNYDEFSCIGSQCPYTCCRGWKIHIDEESLERYHSVSGEIGNEMRDSILIDENKNACIKLNEDGFCPLLNEQNLCRIYIEAGEDKMCNTCQTYPRGVNIYGDFYMKYICISCPEVARILFSQKEPLQFHIVEDENILMPQIAGFNWEYFNALKDGMFTTIHILQNRTLPINVRIQMTLFFNDLFQDCLSKKGNTNEIITMFTHQDTIHLILKNLQRFPRKMDYFERIILEFNRQLVTKSDNIWDIMEFIEAAIKEFQKNENRDHLSLAEFMNSERVCNIFENYCVYYVIQHYLKSYEKMNPQKCIVKMIHFCVIFAWLFGLYGSQKTLEDYTIIVSLFSRKTEHCFNDDSIFDVICDSLCEQGMGTTDYLLSILA